MSEFHQWLASEAPYTADGCSIFIHDKRSMEDEALIRRIVQYLNEYDEEGEGRWLAATHELVERISVDPFLRQLVGLDEEPSHGQSLYEGALSALATRGHIVAHRTDAEDPGHISPKRFDVGLGDMHATCCHMILNPDKISHDQIAPIIGDVFLDWARGESIRSQGIAGWDVNPCLAKENICREAGAKTCCSHLSSHHL
jgi:hypothetical protein